MATRGRPPKPETQVARAAVELYRQTQGKAPIKPKAKYDAAGHGRRLAGWTPPSTGPNDALKGLQTIRNRTRDSERNDWSANSATTKWTTSLIGIGITPRFKRITNKSRKQAILDLYHDFVKQADADGVLNYYGLQTLAVRSWLSSGEVFARYRARFIDEGLAVPMQIQLLEADMCPMLDADTYQGLPAGNRIRSGIELNKRGRRVAYWFYKEHPGDRPNGTVTNAEDLVRVAASEVVHIFEPTRPGQLRGVSHLAPILTRLRNIENYDDATLTRQQLANLVVAFITRSLPPLTGDEDIDGLTGQAIEEDPAGNPLVGLQPGLVQELDDGQDVKWSNPPEAGTNYPDYMRTQHMGTAAGTGLPYELFAGDIKEVSDRTLRVIINEFRRHAEQRQWQIIIPQFCEKTIAWFANAAFMVGAVSEEERDAITRAEWAPHGWAYIHPVQDPQGKKLEVESGFRSRSSVIGERGDDPEMVDEERAADIEREKAMGLYADPTGQLDANGEPIQQPETEEDGIDNEEYSAPPNAMLLERLDRIEANLRQPVKAAEKTEPVHLTVNNHIPQTTVENNIPAPNVTVENSVTSPSVHVSNQVEPTPVNVAVAAPNIQVHNDVKPADVKVELPARKTETSIVRDAKGNIVKATQIETDAQEGEQ